MKLDGWRTGLWKWRQKRQAVRRNSQSWCQDSPGAVVWAGEGVLSLEGVSVDQVPVAERARLVASAGQYSVTTKTVGSEVRLL